MKIVIIVIVILGLTFAVLGSIEVLKTFKYDKMYYKVNEDYDINKLFTSKIFENIDARNMAKNIKYYIIYLFSSDDCSPCTKEILDYVEIVNKYYGKQNIQQLGVITDSSMLRLKMYLKRNIFNMPIYYGNDIQCIEPLQHYNNKEVRRQALVVDKERNKIIFRIYLKKGFVSEEEEKREILSYVFN